MATSKKKSDKTSDKEFEQGKQDGDKGNMEKGQVGTDTGEAHGDQGAGAAPTDDEITKPAPSGSFGDSEEDSESKDSQEEGSEDEESEEPQEKGKEDRQAEQEDNVPWHFGMKDPDKAAPGGGGPNVPGAGPSPEALDKERARIAKEKEEAEAESEEE